MGLIDTIRGWFGGSQRAELEAAEIDAAADEVSEVRADELADMRLGANADEFDADQSAPHP